MLLLLFCCSVLSDSLQTHRLQNTRLPCPSLSPGVCSNSYALNWWCHPTISSSVVPFLSCLQSFPASGSFPMSRLFESGGQRIGTSALALVLSVNIQGWFPLVLIVLISLLSKGLSGVFFSTTIRKQILQWSAFFMVQLSHLYMTTGKIIAWLYGPLLAKWYLCFLIYCPGPNI